MTPGYPAGREADVVLKDGSTVHLRPVRPDDEEALRGFFADLDPTSQAFRFFSGAVDLDGIAKQMAEVDYADSYGLIASRGPERRIVGHGIYVKLGEKRAEVAFAVASEIQGHGLGTILLAHLAEAASEARIPTFVAEVLAQNHRMIEMFRQSGFPVATESTADGLHVEFPTSFSPEAVARFADRDRLAAKAAVTAFFEPRSVAVVGASRHRGTVGGEVFHNLLESGYDGPLYPVNPATARLRSVPAFASVSEIPGEIDLAVLVVRAELTAAVARECAAKGARSVVVLAAGFAEAGPDGAARERELLGICREAGMRLIGPNCLGILDGDPEAGLNATFAPTVPPPGNVGFVTQSGALGLSLLDFAAGRGLGVSSFASVGNRADITANDLLEYWEEDERTELALLYIESFSDPGRFSRVARRVGRRKPVVVVKSGRSASGARAAGSHTGAILAASDRATEALFEQTGVVRAETLSEMLDVASLLSSQPLPAGPRVGILTNAGGPAIMCADACEAAGLEVPAAPEEIRDRLREFLPEQASLGNPVDMIASASAEQYRRAIEVLGSWEDFDALIVIFIRPLQTRAEEVDMAIRAALEQMPRAIPVQAVFMSPEDSVARAEAPGFPVHLYPEDAARALGKVERYVRRRERPEPSRVELPDARADEAAAIISEGLAEGREWLSFEACAQLLDCYGIAMPESLTAADPMAAGDAAARLGGAVALKAHGPGILHKTELGAVRAGLEGEAEVTRAAGEMDRKLEAAGVSREGFLVQRMVGDGVELLVGVATDPVFGPVVACGAGGTAVELLGDLTVRVCPLSADDGAEMIGSLAIFPMLTGFRGVPPVDLDELTGLVLRVGGLADAHREVVELDLNPVMATASGALAIDARIRLAAAAPPRPWPVTWA
ncbi:MAG: GNAT family N-acetyltransferase [Solirubrobacterales bacterium]